MYDELIQALRELDMCGACPCDRIDMCEENDKDCITIQAADAIEELQRIVSEYQKFDGFLAAHGMYEVGPVIPIEPPKEATE